MRAIHIIVYSLLGIGLVIFAMIKLMDALSPALPSKLTVTNNMNASICVYGPADHMLEVQANSQAGASLTFYGEGGFSIYQCINGQYLGTEGYYSRGYQVEHVINIDSSGAVEYQMLDYSAQPQLSKKK